jgi:hypothetical protein
MDNYEDDEIEEVESTEPEVAAEEAGAAAAASSNRNFLIALGVLGGIFLLLIIGLVALFLMRRNGGTEAANIQLTNQAILVANTQTAGAATQLAIEMLTPSITPIPSDTPVPPTPTRTSVVALATATATGPAGSAQLFTATPSATGQVGGGQAGTAQAGTAQAGTGTVPAALTQAAGQTRTAAVNLTATATRLPQSGFAEDVGLPGLFGMAIGLLLVIVLVRRLRFATTTN